MTKGFEGPPVLAVVPTQSYAVSKKPPFPHLGCVPHHCPPYGGSFAELRGNCTRTYCLLMSTTEAYLPSNLRQPEAAMAQKGQPPRSPSLSSVSAITGCLLMSYPGQKAMHNKVKMVHYIYCGVTGYNFQNILHFFL